MTEETSVGALHLRGLTKTFGGQVVLSGVGLTVRPGEVHCLLGQNGSGKSTLIKIISGFYLPDGDAEAFVGTDVLPFGDPKAVDRLGLRFVHQGKGIIGRLSAADNLALTSGYPRGRLGQVDRRAHEHRTLELLHRLGVDDLDVRQPLDTARAIDRTAVAVARAVDPRAGNLRFLFLDEPTATLPATEAALLFSLVAELKSSGVGLVYVTHRLDEVFRIGDDVTILRDGKSKGTFALADLDSTRLIELIVGESKESARRPGSTLERAAPRDGNTMDRPLQITSMVSKNLKGITMSVGRGEIVGVAGLTGSGREELAYAIGGAIPSTFTEFTVEGKPMPKNFGPDAALSAGITMAPSNTSRGGGIGEFSIYENITLPVLKRFSRLGLLSKAQERRVAGEWMTRLKMSGHELGNGGRQLYATLSGGTQQKTILARLLNLQPSVIVLDDPTAGVDVGARKSIHDFMRDYAALGISFVVCSSDVNDFIGISDRVFVLHQGHIDQELIGAGVTEQALLTALSSNERSQVRTSDREAIV